MKRSLHSDTSFQQAAPTFAAGPGYGTWVFDVSRRLLEWSVELHTLHDVRSDDGTSDPFTILQESVHEDDLEEALALYTSAREEGVQNVYRYRVPQPEGAVRILEVRRCLHRDADGQTTKLVGSTIDVTPVTAQQTSHTTDHDALVKLALDATQQGYWSWNLVTGAVNWSPQVAALLGVEHDVLGFSLTSYQQSVHPEDREAVQEALRHAVEHAGAFKIDHRVTWPNGTIRWIANHARVYADEDDRPIQVSGTIADITQRHEAEDALRMTQFAMDHAADMVLWIAPNGDITYANDEARRTLGYDEADLPGLTIQAIEKKYRAPWEQRVVDIRNAGRLTTETTLRRKDGSDCQVELSLSFFSYGGDEHITASARATGKQRAAVEARHDSEARYRTVVAAVAEGIIFFDSTGTVLTANPSALRMLSLSSDQLQGNVPTPTGWRVVQPDGTVVHPGEGPAAKTVKDGFSRQKVVQGIELPGGSKKWISMNTEPIFAPSGETVLGVVASISDITERKLAEDEVSRLTEELENRVRERTIALEASNQELESFAYSVSHDLRAPLRALDGLTRILLNDHAGNLDEEGRRLFHRIQNAARRMGGLIDDLLELSRVARKELRKTEVDLSAVAQEIVNEYRQAEPDRSITAHIMPDITVRGDPGLLRIVLENLIGNAWKFSRMRDQPTITFGKQDGESHVACFVRDNGAGFDMEYAHKLFGPFQRLHSEREFDGSGIGLATVKRIIGRHGGTVWAVGEVNKGATFCFQIPSGSATG